MKSIRTPESGQIHNLHKWYYLFEPLLSWYREHARALPWRETKDPYRIWVSEIMLQQTRVEAVQGYYARFMEELPDIPSLAACPEDHLLKLWEGLGYYSRARNLKKAAIQIMTQYDGILPADHAALLKLPGIGPYTAGAIASIAFGLPVPAVDGNVLRVRARVFGDTSDIGDQKVKREVETELDAFLSEVFSRPEQHGSPAVKPDAGAEEPDGSDAGTFNQALMDLGATVCLPNGAPLCDLCPWQMTCAANLEGRTDELPVKQKKKPRRIEQRTVFLIMDGDRVVLHKRPASGLLAGLYELPNTAGHLSEKEALSYVRSIRADAEHASGLNPSPLPVSGYPDKSSPPEGLTPLYIQKLESAKHIFTHIEWHMTGYLIRVDSLTSASTGLLFADQTDVRERYSIPSAFDAYIRHIRNA